MTEPVEPVTYAQLVEANETLRQQLSHAEHKVLVVTSGFCELQERLFNQVAAVLGEYEREMKQRHRVEVEPQRTQWHVTGRCPDA